MSKNNNKFQVTVTIDEIIESEVGKEVFTIFGYTCVTDYPVKRLSYIESLAANELKGEK